MTLCWIIGLPLLGALALFLTPKGKNGRPLAFVLSTLTFLLSLQFYSGFDPFNGGFQFEQRLDLGVWLGFHDSLGVDGVSLWFVLLTTLLTPLVVAVPMGPKTPDKNYYACLLGLEAAFLGAFSAADLFLFFLCWETVLVGFFLLIRFWGSARRARATFQFVLCMTAASLLLLGVFLVAVHQAHDFDYSAIFDRTLPDDVQFWCFLALAVAFLIQIPLPPFHVWMPEVYAEAPLGGLVFLSALLSNLAVYGFVRYGIPLFPYAAKGFGTWLLWWGLGAVVYGSFRALLQTDLRKLAASLALVQMGWVFLGLFSYSLTGFEGALLQSLALGVALPAFFLVLEMLMRRRGSRRLDRYGGWAHKTPLLSVAFLAAGLGLSAFPGTGGFDGILLILVSAQKVFAPAAWAAAATFVFSFWVLSTAFVRIFAGAPGKVRSRWGDLSWGEGALLAVLGAVSFLIGFCPNLFLAPMEKTVQLNVLQRLNPPPVMTDFAAQQRRLQDGQHP